MMFALIVFVSVGVSSLGINPAAPERHDFHVSHTRLAVENKIIVTQTRFFKDDLATALNIFGNLNANSLDTSPSVDSLFTSYFNQRFVIKVGEEHLRGHIIGSGEDVEGDEAVWWYAMQFEASVEPRSMFISNTLLIETFDDQKNVLKIQKFPSEKSLTYYFDSDETKIEVKF